MGHRYIKVITLHPQRHRQFKTGTIFMRQKWSLIKEGVIAKTITNGISGGKRNLVGGRSSANHSDEWLLVNGYLPHEEPVILWYQVKGVPFVDLNHVGYAVNNKSEAEIDTILERDVESVGNAKVAEIASPPEKIDRMIARGIQLERKERKYGLTAEEEVEAALLDAVNLACYNVRKAGMDMIVATLARPLTEKTNLNRTWAEDNIGWPA